MAAVLEQPKVCQHEELGDDRLCVECGQYVMPKIRQGDDITYYDPTITESRKTTGFVLKVARTNRTIQVFVPASGAIVDMVRHVSDPKLKESPDHRENGAWDYSERTREINQRFDDMAKRIADMEAAVISFDHNKATKKKPEHE